MFGILGLMFQCIVFGIACFISWIIYLIFSRHKFSLMIVYLIGILLGAGILGINYWRFDRLTSLSVPFTSTTNNQLAFTFLPEYSGNYSIDLTFLNQKINEKYESCEFAWEEVYGANKNDCKSALIYRTINVGIDDHHFSGKAQYRTPSLNHFEYSFYNHNLMDHPALNLFTFDGKANTPVSISVKIDANADEIKLAKPAIVIGSADDNFDLIDLEIGLFIPFALPFIFSIIILGIVLGVARFKNRK